METVSIIMPAYNCEKYIGQAIESVKKQTYSDWILIIIEDASNDNTVEEINIKIKDIKEKVIFIKNMKHIGIAKSRNIGIEKSDSKYIAFLDADDIWDKEKLEKQLNFMLENKYSFTYTNFSYKKQERIKKVKLFPKKLDYKKALKNTFILTSTVMIDITQINKELIKMPNIQSEDTATWWNILKKNFIAYGLKERLTIYRVHKEGKSFNKIKNIKRTWNLYRNYEKFNFSKSLYYFLNYIINAIFKRVI